MDNAIERYDVIIIGGGLAGLALSIQLARAKYKILVCEKDSYPITRVCGEYISNESRDFINALGIDLQKLGASNITELLVTAENGKVLQQRLPLGGFGISRDVLDLELATLARAAGVTVLEHCKVSDVQWNGNLHTVVAGSSYQSKVVAGCYGKRSNLDVKWKRPFTTAKKSALNNFIGIKYHIHAALPNDTIALHNFKNGYCGVVKIEGDLYNLCYLTTAANLQAAKGNIEELELTVLGANKYLNEILKNSQKVFTSPITISQVSFAKKTQVQDHQLMLGDAAGMITPLCGNGMSMALHASVLAAKEIELFLKGDITRVQMEQRYTSNWRNQFGTRLKTGRLVQRMLSNSAVAGLFVSLIKPFPGIVHWLIRRTHGKPF